MKRVVQVRRLRFTPINRQSATHLEPGDRLEVVRVKPAREFRNGRRVPERVTIEVARELSKSEFDILAADR
jgi:hypothetical protein